MKVDKSLIFGNVSKGYEEVEKVFIDNFEKRGELGAACCVYKDGVKVVDLWGGYRDVKKKKPWEEDTMVLVFSSTKGVSSMALAHAHSKGLFDYDEKVSTYWPEFACNGKEAITVRQLLSHKAGLCAIDEPMEFDIFSRPTDLFNIIAKQKPAWQPGVKHGYHGISLGWYESALIYSVDPKKRTIGEYFRDEIAKPLEIDFHIGLPDEVDRERIAEIYAPAYKFRMLFNMKKLPKEFVKGMVLDTKSITYRTFSNPSCLGNIPSYNKESFKKVELPASNGIGEVRSIAKAYSVFATGGSELGLTEKTMGELTGLPILPKDGSFDEVLKLDMTYLHGYTKPSKDFNFGTNQRAFGTMGAGGSFCFADPEIKASFAYAMTKSGFHLYNDPREKALRDAVYQCFNDLK